MKSIEKRLKKVLIEYGIDRNKISKDTDYYFDLNLDILDLMGLARKIKNEFLINIPDNEILRMERVSDTPWVFRETSGMKNMWGISLGSESPVRINKAYFRLRKLWFDTSK